MTASLAPSDALRGSVVTTTGSVSYPAAAFLILVSPPPRFHASTHTFRQARSLLSRHREVWGCIGRSNVSSESPGSGPTIRPDECFDNSRPKRFALTCPSSHNTAETRGDGATP